MNRPGTELAHILQQGHAAAVRSVQPETAMRAPLRELSPGTAPCWVISVGKAANGMARAIVDWLAEHGREPAGGLVVAAESQVPPSRLRLMVGNHPIAGPDSARAAAAIGDLIDTIPSDAEVHVAISGGASALMAGPLPPLSAGDLTRTFEALISTGLDIREMNAVRKRVTRWSAGRLALRLAPRRLHVWIISDVAGDDVASIASGPCTGDPWTSAAVQAMLVKREILAKLPDAVQQALTLETPKPFDPWLAAIAPRVVANNAIAREAAATSLGNLGIATRVMPDPLVGEAQLMGRTLAASMLSHSGERTVMIWGGETTVTIDGTAGIGGRSQELALAAADALQGSNGVLLAAGTDGRDGPTDAAGAIVNGETWRRIIAAGRDPSADLAGHDAYPALASVDALLRTGPSGTNVMDLVLAATGWP